MSKATKWIAITKDTLNEVSVTFCVQDLFFRILFIFFHSHLTLVSFISEILLFYVQLSSLYSLSIRFIIRYKMLCSMVFSLFIFIVFILFFFCCELLWVKFSVSIKTNVHFVELRFNGLLFSLPFSFCVLFITFYSQDTGQ